MIKIVLAGAIAGAFLFQDTSQTEGKVPWFKDHAKAVEAARDTGKPIFIFFGCC